VKRALVGVSVVLAALAWAGCDSARFVERVVIGNPTAFTANVDVAGGKRDGWLGLTTVAARSETTVEQVLDQGSMWVFRFSYAGYDEEVEVSRAELARSGWHVEVPQTFDAALRDRGISPPP
jgi:hypothetical protein